MAAWLSIGLLIIIGLVASKVIRERREAQRKALADQEKRRERERRIEREAKAAASHRSKPETSPPKSSTAASKEQPLSTVSVERSADAYGFEIVGESRCQANLIAIAGPKERIGKAHYCAASVEREPVNAYDSNACMVRIDGKKVGYIPKGDNKRLIAERSEQGFPFNVPALIVGGWMNGSSEGNYGVRLAMPSNSPPATQLERAMVGYVEGKTPRGLTQSQVKNRRRQWKADQSERYDNWQSLEEIIKHLQSADGREEFEIKKPATALIQDAFEQLISEGEDPEDLAAGCDVVVERMLTMRPDLVR